MAGRAWERYWVAPLWKGRMPWHDKGHMCKTAFGTMGLFPHPEALDEDHVVDEGRGDTNADRKCSIALATPTSAGLGKELHRG